MKMSKLKSIIISRTDSIGDVILTLPMAGVIKSQMPNVKVFFLAKDYAKSVVLASNNIDEFLSLNYIENLTKEKQIEYIKNIKADAIIHVFPNKFIAKLALKAGVKNRIGTSHRLFHLLTCNKLVKLGRKNSNLHEAQLNLELLKPLGVNININLDDIYKYYNFNKFKELPENIENKLSKKRKNIIFHPKSKGSAREWGLENFGNLIKLLPENEYKIFITGTHEEGLLMKYFLQINSNRIEDLTGYLSLSELISFISKSDVLVAASTGPLHIAAACGIKAIGIFAPMRPIHPGRWKPLGERATYIVKEEYCDDCKKTGVCKCITDLSPKLVYNKILE
jgi:ADP-heptose:LPS heptosyltransferase